MIQGVKYLRLYWIKIVKLEKHLQFWIVQGCLGQRLEVQKIGVGWMFFGQNQMLETDGAVGFTSQPPIGYGSDIILCGQRLKNGNGKHYFRYLFFDHVFLGDQIIFVMIYVIVDGIFNPYPEGF